MIRFFDLLLSTIGLIVTFPILLVLIVIGYIENGSPFFTQKRVGRYQKSFVLVKLRTMKPDTASVATHLADANSITTYGHFLRRSKLDELPQLLNVLKGEMSLVGPRPCLFNQNALIEARQVRGVFKVRPGVTGLAQIKSIDMSTPGLLAETDSRMIEELTLRNYFWFIFMTLLGRGVGDRIRK